MKTKYCDIAPLSGELFYKIMYNSGRNKKVKLAGVRLTCEQGSSVQILMNKCVLHTFTSLGFCFLCIFIVTVF